MQKTMKNPYGFLNIHLDFQKTFMFFCVRGRLGDRPRMFILCNPQCSLIHMCFLIRVTRTHSAYDRKQGVKIPTWVLHNNICFIMGSPGPLSSPSPTIRPHPHALFTYTCIAVTCVKKLGLDLFQRYRNVRSPNGLLLVTMRVPNFRFVQSL